MKPMLASDWDEGKQTYPVIAQPKIDGVRGLNMLGKLTGRSLKPFKNRHVTDLFGHSALLGLDGEFAAEHECNPDLCRLTTSALGTITGQPYVIWHLFDYATPETREMPYHIRRRILSERLEYLRLTVPHIAKHLQLVPSVECSDAATVAHFDSKWLDQGYEGTILRDPMGLHKQGRSTVKEGGLLRIKRFVDFEFTVTEVIEGDENTNEAQINELGHTFRSSHQENKVKNGLLGAMKGTLLADVCDAGKVLFPRGSEVHVGAGRMTHAQRKEFFENPALLMSFVSKGKLFPKGTKDKPRFPTWQGFRSAEDMS
jgi:DNA ligase 1